MALAVPSGFVRAESLIPALAKLAASPWAFPAPSTAPPTREQVMARISACGLRPPRASIGKDPGMGGEDVVRIGRGPAISLRQRVCLVKASADMITFVMFDDPDEQRAFVKLEAEKQAKREPREARRRLRQAGLLDKLPRYDPHRQTLESYMRSLEALCGVTSGSVVESFHNPRKPSLLTPQPTSLDLSPGGGERLFCVQDAIAASNLADHGIHFGFVGNEIIEEPAKAK
ncbi:hypothetical protein ASE00_17850 [Sphingomonas sp. Root710]|nr:hypothetical protein ASE00_17850 [Sphingomonas sp. Root710]